MFTTSYRYNWGKSTQVLFRINIRRVFVPIRCSPSSPNNEPKAMVRPFVKISLDQYEGLDRLGKERKESLSKLIREALSSFTKKKEYSVRTPPSFLLASTKDKYKTVTAYFPRRGWDLLQRISDNTGRCKTELLRIALEDYVRDMKVAKDRVILKEIRGRDSLD